MSNELPELMTEVETAAYLTVSRATLRRMWRDGLIVKPLRIGRRGIRWRRDDLQAFVRNRAPITLQEGK